MEFILHISDAAWCLLFFLWKIINTSTPKTTTKQAPPAAPIIIFLWFEWGCSLSEGKTAITSGTSNWVWFEESFLLQAPWENERHQFPNVLYKKYENHPIKLPLHIWLDLRLLFLCFHYYFNGFHSILPYFQASLVQRLRKNSLKFIVFQVSALKTKYSKLNADPTLQVDL